MLEAARRPVSWCEELALPDVNGLDLDGGDEPMSDSVSQLSGRLSVCPNHRVLKSGERCDAAARAWTIQSRERNDLWFTRGPSSKRRRAEAKERRPMRDLVHGLLKAHARPGLAWCSGWWTESPLPAARPLAPGQWLSGSSTASVICLDSLSRASTGGAALL